MRLVETVEAGLTLALALAAPCPSVAQAQASAPEEGEPSPSDLWTRESLLGSMGGLRTDLGRIGVDLGLTDMDEVLGNVAGGIRRGATYDGLTTLTLQLDTDKAFGWPGGTVQLSALNIRGRNVNQYYVGALQTVSGIEAENSTRLWEIWYQQSFLDDHADIKLGQQSVDFEFITAPDAEIFLNTAMGWPLLPSYNQYAGGPAYPLSSLGVRLRGSSGPVTVLGGVFQDNPPGGPFNSDSQLLGSTRWGGNFNLRTGALVIGELQYALNPPDKTKAGPGAGGATAGPPGVYKLGFWVDTAPFPSPRYDNQGTPLASPASNGVARTLRNNFSLYAVMNQQVWRPDPGEPRAVAVFARLMGAPGDRNLISFAINAGLTLKAPLAGRDDDTLGLGFGFGQISGAAAGFDRDTALFTAPGYPVRSSETFLELTYQAQVTPWLQVQPDLQAFFNVGGGVPNPLNPATRIGNALVIGARSNITF